MVKKLDKINSTIKSTRSRCSISQYSDESRTGLQCKREFLSSETGSDQEVHDSHHWFPLSPK